MTRAVEITKLNIEFDTDEDGELVVSQLGQIVDFCYGSTELDEVTVELVNDLKKHIEAKLDVSA